MIQFTRRRYNTLVVLHDPLANGKAYPGTLVLIIFMEALKYIKDPVFVLRIKAYAVIGHGQVAVIYIRHQVLITQLTANGRNTF